MSECVDGNEQRTGFSITLDDVTLCSEARDDDALSTTCKTLAAISGDIRSKHNESEGENRVIFNRLCDGACLENCCAEPLKCDKNVPQLNSGTKYQVKQRACSSIRRIQEKLQGDLLQNVHRDQHIAIGDNKISTKSPKPTSSSALYHTRRQRSRSRASKFGKTASYLTQRPYRRWLGVSTNIFSDSRYIVSSKRRTNPTDLAAGNIDPLCEKAKTSDDRTISQQELDQSESRKNVKVVNNKSLKQRRGRPAKVQTEKNSEMSPLSTKQENDRVKEEISVQPQTEMSSIVENHKNGRTGEIGSDQLEEKYSLQCCNDSENRISMSSPFRDVTSRLEEKEQQDEMEGDATEPFPILSDGSSSSDMEIQYVVQRKRNEDGMKKEEHMVDNGLLSSDTKSLSCGSEEADLWTVIRNQDGQRPFQFSGQCTPETFDESLTSGPSSKVSLSPKPRNKKNRRWKGLHSPTSQHKSEISQGSKSPPAADVCESKKEEPRLHHRIDSDTPDPQDSFRQDGGLAGNVVSVPRYEFIKTPPDVLIAPAKASGDLQAVPFDGTNGINPLREELKQYLELGLHPMRTKASQISAIQRFVKRSRKDEVEQRQYYNVQAIKSFEGKLPGQLQFEKGQIIKQLDTGLLPKNGMSYGYYKVGRLRRKKVGLYPCSYVTCQVEESD